MTDEQPSVQVQFTDDFKRQLATLAKKHRQIRSDVQPIISQLQLVGWALSTSIFYVPTVVA